MGSCASFPVHCRVNTNIPNAELVSLNHPSINHNSYVQADSINSSSPSVKHNDDSNNYNQWWIENEMDTLVAAVQDGDTKTIKMYHMLEIMRTLNTFREMLVKKELS